MISVKSLLSILLAFEAFLELATSAPSECPGGWTYVDTGDSCYKFLKGVKDGLRGRLTGDEAEQACITLGGHLATIPSGEIGLAIESNIKTLNKIWRNVVETSEEFPSVALNITDSYHIGLRYDFATQKWRWTDGKEAIYTNWEPYDSRSGCANTVDAKKNGACVEVGHVDVKHRVHGHWRNIHCDGRSGHWNEAMCQRPTCAKMPCSRIERTFLFVKPDGVQRGLVGKIIQRFEERGYKLVGLKQVHASRKQLEDHYRRLNAQPFYEELIVHMSSSPVVAMVCEGLEAVKQAQAMLGASDPLTSVPGTIRGDYAIQGGRNSCSRIERTFVFVKPDGVQRGLVGKIIQRFEERGYKLVGLKQVHASRKQLEDHYRRLNANPFYAELIAHMSSSPVVAMVWEGLEAVKQAQIMLGASDPLTSAPGTIRGDYVIQGGRNVCDASESVEEAQRAIAYWFKPEEVFDYKLANEKWIYEPEQLHGPNSSRNCAHVLEV
ncbi:Nucleoside diphosphate kinase [Aphelenchoides avenae]|nr:Nucleoside diphosphate kinase [Aphelenchus avenae]